MNESITIEQLATLLGGRLEDARAPVTERVMGLAPLTAPRPGAVVVAETAAQVAALAGAPVSVVVTAEGLETGLERGSPHPLLKVKDTRLALATLSALFDTRPRPTLGVSPAAHVHPEAILGENLSVAAGVVIGAGAQLGDGCVIHPGCVVGAGAVVGEGCVLHANVTLYDGVRLGSRVTLHSGVVLGADGFGYARGPRGAVKIHHLGTVEIGDDVEIGANTCVDRGTLHATVIGPRTKIDNLCQIGHNVRIGADCLIAGTVGIAGSTTLGNGVVVGGNAGFADHLTIGDGAQIAGRAGVIKDVPAGETWAGFPARPYRTWVRGLYLLGRLETIWARVKTLDRDGDDL